ncbi:hypothetical protein ACFDR9_001438 [Janthinobacterium sp. CG_23.3]|uniref:YgaP family membrane protein n=1 Tax=unclassified Janthinobacterium TaxID=2610881 RepID=UPI0003497881|nr:MULTISPECIES: DUF2892 domain-containing protein [unclassified Janthinobacterium]MEC5160068.1 hypothetical protein [Janthinobacterium sp. CG_S6]
MFYMKNVPGWERLLRAVAGLLAIAFGVLALGGAAGVGLALGGAGLVASGLFGFCPMCALLGRRLDRAGRADDAR